VLIAGTTTAKTLMFREVIANLQAMPHNLDGSYEGMVYMLTTLLFVMCPWSMRQDLFNGHVLMCYGMKHNSVSFMDTRIKQNVSPVALMTEVVPAIPRKSADGTHVEEFNTVAAMINNPLAFSPHAWMCLFWQGVFAIAKMQSVWPRWRHNDMHSGNVLVYVPNQSMVLRYVVGGVMVKISTPVVLRLCDFDLVTIDQKLLRSDDSRVGTQFLLDNETTTLYDVTMFAFGVRNGLQNAIDQLNNVGTLTAEERTASLGLQEQYLRARDYILMHVDLSDITHFVGRMGKKMQKLNLRDMDAQPIDILNEMMMSPPSTSVDTSVDVDGNASQTFFMNVLEPEDGMPNVGGSFMGSITPIF
jgi:hypothetical protein